MNTTINQATADSYLAKYGEQTLREMAKRGNEFPKGWRNKRTGRLLPLRYRIAADVVRFLDGGV